MERPGNYFDALVERLCNFRKAFPDAGIGGDFIAGFPGETNEMFEETLTNIEKIGFSYGHVFRYSKRPSTTAAASGAGSSPSRWTAAAFEDQVDVREKNERGERLRAILDKCRQAFVAGLIGTSHRIIIESENPATGVSSNYVRMEVHDSAIKRNSWLSVTLTGVNPQNNRCIAEPKRPV